MKLQTLLVFFALSLLIPTQAVAQDAKLEAAQKKFAGTYTATQGAKQERASIGRVIDKVVAEMTFFKRPFARSALEDSTEPCAQVSVSFSADTMTINCKGRLDVTSPKDGSTVKWKNEDGDVFPLTQKLEPGRMVQVFKGESGTKKRVYTLVDGGKTLKVAVTISSDSLPRPLKYTRRLRRKK